VTIIYHPTGNQNVRATVKGLVDAGKKIEFHTSIACFPNTLLNSLSYVGPLSELRRRSYDSVLKELTHSHPLREMGRLLANRMKFSALTRHEVGYLSIDAVYRGLDKLIAKKLKYNRANVNAVYAYEDGAAFSFAVAKKLGITCLYDLPIGYWRTARKLLQNEQNRWPEWKMTLTGLKDSEEKLKRKDEELKLSDAIFVASSFTAKTLKDFPGKLPSIAVIPYGFPDVKEYREYTGLVNRKKLKILFVGGLSQRKGIADLFSAAETLNNYIELTIVGKKATDECTALNEALSRHKWIPSLPHQEVLQLMRQQDILIFPSLFEGFGLVITEAMSQGLPVITTDRTAGPDLIEHGSNGWLVEAGSTTALHQAIEYFLQQPDRVAQLGREAQETASKRPWAVYGSELATAIANSIHS
jgi:glycosyltransferase involved in cell wall biosynthesis